MSTDQEALKLAVLTEEKSNPAVVPLRFQARNGTTLITPSMITDGRKALATLLIWGLLGKVCEPPASYEDVIALGNVQVWWFSTATKWAGHISSAQALAYGLGAGNIFLGRRFCRIPAEVHNGIVERLDGRFLLRRAPANES